MRAFFGICALSVLTSCGTNPPPQASSPGAAAVTCGAGTVLFEGACLPDDSVTPLACGEGTETVDGVCVSTGAADGPACGEGTQAVNGMCVAVDARTGLTCGEGTEAVDGACVPTAPINELVCGESTEAVDGACVPTAPINELVCGEGTEAVDGACMPTDEGPTETDDDERSILVAAWDAANRFINNGLGYTGHSNREAILSQNEDAILEAILEMYRATSEISYLQLFVQHADLVLSWRDDHAGFTDYNGESHPVWSNAYDQYVEDGRAYPFLLESGQLTWPLADFAQQVLNDEALQDQDAGDGRTLFAVAQGYVTAAEETLGFHHRRWHTDTVSIDGEPIDIGWFSAQADADFLIGIPAGGVLPVNHQTSMGRTIAALYAATGNPSHGDRAERIARWVALELSVDDGGAYVWHYWPEMTYFEGLVDNSGNDDIEDFSHAILTTQFAHILVEAGLGVWDAGDLDRFERTFRQNLYTGIPGEFYVLVDGTHRPTRPGDRYQSARFLRVASYGENPAEHYEIARYTLLDMLAVHECNQIGGATGLLSLAELIRFWDLQ